MKADKLEKRLWNLEIKDDEINEVYQQMYEEMEQNKTAPK